MKTQNEKVKTTLFWKLIAFVGLTAGLAMLAVELSNPGESQTDTALYTPVATQEDKADYGANVQYSDSQGRHSDAKVATPTIKEMREYVTAYEFYTDNLQGIIILGGDLDDLDLEHMLRQAATYEAFKKLLAERE